MNLLEYKMEVGDKNYYSLNGCLGVSMNDMECKNTLYKPYIKFNQKIESTKINNNTIINTSMN